MYKCEIHCLNYSSVLILSSHNIFYLWGSSLQKLFTGHILHVELMILIHFTDSVDNHVHCFVHFKLAGGKGRKENTCRVQRHKKCYWGTCCLFHWGRWHRLQFPLTVWYTSSRIHSTTSQNTLIFKVTAVRISSFAYCSMFANWQKSFVSCTLNPLLRTLMAVSSIYQIQKNHFCIHSVERK